MDESPNPPECLIHFTEAALIDLAGIDNATAATWGVTQAERYLNFLDNVFNDLAQRPSLGNLVDQHDGYRSYIAKFKKQRGTYGHRVFYRQIEGGILVVRILHTAMNWPDYL